MNPNSSGQITNANIDQYRLFGREILLEYVEIGAGCQFTIRAFEPVSGITSQLKEVVLLGDLQIQNFLFYNCKNLSKITGASHITLLGASSIDNCSSLTKLICENAAIYVKPRGCDSLKILYCRYLGSDAPDNLNVCFFRPD